MWIIICLCLVSAGELCAQYKLEREHRIRADEAPEAARSFISDLALPRRPKWYREEGLHSQSYEAKVKAGLKYSFEFSIDGIFQDGEIKIKIDQIPTLVAQKIEAWLSDRYLRYKIRRMQIQYRQKDELQSIVRSATLNFVVEHYYELVIVGTSDRTFTQYEILFDRYGQLQSVREILSTPTDIIEF